MSSITNKFEAILGTQSSGKLDWITQYTNSINSYNTSSYTQSGNLFPDMLPIAMQVSAKTVGIDLVSVKPMSGPKGLLAFIDYKYGKKDRISKIRNIIDKVNIRLNN